MSSFLITGGVPLCGSVRVSGSKNAVLPMMAASILASEPVELLGVPQLADVRTLRNLLRHLGVQSRRTADGLSLTTDDAAPIRAPLRLVRRMRASFCVLGPLLARRGRAVVPLPGGCSIGDRPVDLHLKGLAALGANILVERGCVVARAARLRGATVSMRGPCGPTVTGTANVLSAAVLAQGTTTITGAAVEPEIVDLGNFLNSLGAKIDGLGTPTIRVMGVDELGGGAYRVIPDRIEAATLLLAVAIAGGSATVCGVVPEHLAAVFSCLRAAGCVVGQVSNLPVGRVFNSPETSWKLVLRRLRQVSNLPHDITITADCPPRPLDVTAEPYPGVPTDVQAQLTALLCLARGRSLVRDCVFPGRFLHVAELRRLGASIECREGAAAIAGVEQLTGAAVTASDLRASAALVLAGLAAEGTTRVDHAEHLDRGYQRLDEKLGQLGARIERFDTTLPRDASASVVE
jgi:UDP-N-acetylglucosamine 1-carboxyvinyltransferase